MGYTYTKARTEDGKVVLKEEYTNTTEFSKERKLEDIDQEIEIIESDIVRLQAELTEKQALKTRITKIK